MIAVFASFLKMFGLGFATGILVDATVVRLALVPAALQLMGRANWWLPRGLDRRLPRVDIEGETHLPPEERTPAPARLAVSTGNAGAWQ
jgi:RND superfamily putative drug exporter